MKKLLLFITVLLSSFVSYAQYYGATDVDDLALIYIGAQNRPDWDKDQFRPYVMHTYRDGKKSWMFDAFLMIEFRVWNKNGIEVSLGESNTQGAQKEDWERLLKVQFGLESGNGCKALDDVIGELIPVLGEPGHKHKVVFTLPVAEAKTGITWGSIDNVQLNFQYYQDRVKAMKWYTEQLLAYWKQAKFKNIELDGVYWTKEAFYTVEERNLAKEMNEYYHQKGLNVYWIPYYSAPSYDEWKQLGVDVAYLQPGYYFRNTTPMSRLDDAIALAWHNDMGLEMEFEGYNYTWDPVANVRTRVMPNNTCIYQYSPEYHQRLIDYIDKFEETGSYDFLPIAYYSGFQAVYDLAQSGHAKNKELLDRLAKIINNRHINSGWDKEPSAAINDVTFGDRNIAYGIEGGIYISDGVEGAVSIYSTDGRLVYSSTSSSAVKQLNYGFTVSCQPGVYVVCVDGRSIKVAVR